jgi:hypothetical protein
MKSLTTTLPLTLAIAGLVAGLLVVLPFEQASSVSWLIGALSAAVVGAVVLVLKLTVASPSLTGTAAMKALLTAQVLSFFVRLIAVGVGAVLLLQSERSPVMFVFSFALASLGQQFLEARSLLARNPVKPVKSEVTP